MNCKPGDLAIVVRGPTVEAYGTVLRVKEFIGVFKPGEIFWFRGAAYRSAAGGPVWETDGEYHVASDLVLQPIRPASREDETPTVRELEAA